MQTKKVKFNNNKKQALGIVASFLLLGMATMICLTSIFIWVSDADIFGWFTLIDTPSSNKLNTQVTSGYNVDLGFSADGGTQVEFDNAMLVFTFNSIFAGSANSKTLTITHTNNEARDINISWRFGMPSGSYTGAEVPYQKEGRYYYLGSQLAVTNIQMTVNSTTTPLLPTQVPGKGKFLVSTSPFGVGQVTSVPSPLSVIPPLELVNDITLPAGETATIILTFTFVDNGEDQSIYQEFEGVCSRILYFQFSEVNE